MSYTLSAEYIAEARARAYRYQGQWCGTAGGLAADVARLLIERKTMQDSIQTLADHNEAMMSASEGCCGGGKCHPAAAIVEEAPGLWREMTKASAEKYAADREETVPADWILQGQKEMDATTDDIRWSGDSILADHGDDIRPGSREFLGVLDEMRVLHLRKTKDYGVDEDALSNIRQSADVVNVPAWAGCMIRISDKMHRVRAFFRRGVCEFDGIEDTLIDIACYAVIALVLYREWRKAPRVTATPAGD